MTTQNRVGLAGSPRNPLGPPITRPHSYLQGPFGATLRPSLAAQLAGAYPIEMMLDFLGKRPDVDGYGGQRLVATGHQPQPICLQPLSAADWTIPHAVRFAAPVERDLMLALFNMQGDLMAWGSLLQRTTGPTPPLEIIFPSHHIRVKRIRTN